MRLDIHHHFPDVVRIFDMNSALSSELSMLVDILASKNATISSLSSALDAATADVASQVSSAVDAEDSEVAASISAAIG